MAAAAAAALRTMRQAADIWRRADDTHISGIARRKGWTRGSSLAHCRSSHVLSLLFFCYRPNTVTLANCHQVP